MPSAQPLAPAHDQMDERVKEDESDADIDVEKVASDVYRHILDMMDLARARNGDSYL